MASVEKELKENQNNDTAESFYPQGPSRGSLSIRVFWYVLTVACLAALSYHLSTLIVRFNQQPVTIQTSDSEFQFPDIHVCPQFPFSDSRIRSLADENDTSWLSIAETMRNMTNTAFSINTTWLERYSIVLKAFWDTLTPSLLHENLSLPIYECLIRIKVNNKGKSPDGLLLM